MKKHIKAITIHEKYVFEFEHTRKEHWEMDVGSVHGIEASSVLKQCKLVYSVPVYKSKETKEINGYLLDLPHQLVSYTQVSYYYFLAQK